MIMRRAQAIARLRAVRAAAVLICACYAQRCCRAFGAAFCRVDVTRSLMRCRAIFRHERCYALPYRSMLLPLRYTLSGAALDLPHALRVACRYAPAIRAVARARHDADAADAGACRRACHCSMRAAEAVAGAVCARRESYAYAAKALCAEVCSSITSAVRCKERA